MKIQQKKLEIAIYLKEIWHDPIKETPKRMVLFVSLTMVLTRKVMIPTTCSLGMRR